MVIVGLDTLPSRMTGLPAINPSDGFVMSRSSPMSPFSPGAPCGQSSTTFVGSEAKQLESVRKAKHRGAAMRVRSDFMRWSETKLRTRVEAFPVNQKRHPRWGSCSSSSSSSKSLETDEDENEDDDEEERNSRGQRQIFSSTCVGF